MGGQKEKRLKILAKGKKEGKTRGVSGPNI